MRKSLTAAFVVALVALAGCNDKDAVNQTAGGSDRYVAGSGGITLVKESSRHAPLTFTGTALDGSKISIASYRGKVVVLNEWGSWCAPCRDEIQGIVGASEDLGSGVAFLGINVKDNRAAATAFDRTFKVPYPSLFDPAQRIPASIPDLPPTAIPSTLILDKEGRVAVRFPRAVAYTELVNAVHAVEAEPT